MSRALRALSSTYVERRHKIADGGALVGAGKRAAFALYYAPLHFLLVREIASHLDHDATRRLIVDLGCGTGAAGSALARRSARVLGIDRNQWALGEAARTYRAFGLSATTRRSDLVGSALPKEAATIVAAFTMNEVAEESRNAMLDRLLDRARRNGDRVLIVEPLARSVAPWWDRWTDVYVRAGARADEWRFPAELPPIVEKLDRAAGLDHRELTGRTLFI